MMIDSRGDPRDVNSSNICEPKTHSKQTFVGCTNKEKFSVLRLTEENQHGTIDGEIIHYIRGVSGRLQYR